VEFRILGPLEVWHEGRPVRISGVRQRELLAVLLLDAGAVVSSDRLMDALWGEDQPAAGATALRVRVSQLRRALGAGDRVLVTRAPGYALLVEQDGLDLRRFERLFERAERAMAAGDAPGALAHVEAALSLWRGPPLVDFAYTSFAQAAIVRLEELRAAALELRIDAELALDRHGRVVGELQALVRAHPLRERVWAQLMLALYRDGRQAEALSAYRSARNRLVEEIGVEPGPELQALVQAHPLRERLWAQLMLALYRDGRQAEALAAYRSARSRLVEEIGVEPGPELQTLEARILAQDPSLAAGRPAARTRRSVLALPDTGAVEGGASVIAERLAARSADELLVVGLVEDSDRLGDVVARLGALRQRARLRDLDARVAAFTTADPGADAVRLAAEHDAAVLVLDAPDAALRSGAIGDDL